MEPAPARLLIVDDEVASMRALRDTLRLQGYDTIGVTSGQDALATLRQTSFDVLLTDLMMPGMDGVELLTAAREIDSQIVGVLMTGRGTIETAVDAMKAGALDYVLKPIRLSAIQPVLARAIGVRRLRMENLDLRNTVAIHELNQAMAYTLDSSVLLEKIIDATVAQFQADEASIMLCGEKDLQIAAVRGENREHLLGTRIPLDAGIAGWVAASREPLNIDGSAIEAPWSPLYPRPDIQSALSLPMISRHRLIGVINVACTSQRRIFTPGQIKALSIFTAAAASGIEAARLHDAQRKADARYREVLQMAADAIISVDEFQRIVVFNTAAERIFGHHAADVMGLPLDILIPPDAVEAHQIHVQSFGRTENRIRPMAPSRRLQGRRSDGTLFNAEIDISKRSEHGETLYTAVVRDITLRIHQEERIERLTRLYAMLSGVNSAIVRILDEAELYAEICRIATETGGFTVAYVGTLAGDRQSLTIAASTGMALAGKQTMLRRDAGVAQGPLELAIREKKVQWENDLSLRSDPGPVHSDAVDFGARAVATLPFTLDGDVHAVMLIYADTAGAFGEDELRLLREAAGDVSFALDHIAKTQRVSYLATHDPLTDLPNRALFRDRLAQAMAQASYGHGTLGVVLADIERFRHVNDTFGRQAGDAVLRQFADRLRKVLGERTSPARIGPDIFAMIYTDIVEATEIAGRIREWTERIMGEPFTADGKPLHLAARAGVAFFPADGTAPETLMQNAEAALKRAKGQHERVVCYTPDLNARVAAQLALESKLRRALERNQFILHYQPKIDLLHGGIAGVEALIRWHDPENGLVPPDRFIPLLEETGLILPVGRWAIQEAVRMAARLRRHSPAPMRIAVNVSPIQLNQNDFVEAVREAIGTAGTADHGLDLEITESVIMQDIETNVRKLADLQDMDIKVAIDDFGTGYSSLAYMAKLPVAIIKIDRAFIRDLQKNSDSLSITTSIISLAHALNRIVVAEGVETAEQAKLLRQYGCEQAQGYLFSKPLPADDIERLVIASAEKGRAGR
ncbi:MAG: EAL domain-containing protein [Burkholderiales bacterium]|nr:EAL domain-containing protein [Burkholderiales bacterium]